MNKTRAIEGCSGPSSGRKAAAVWLLCLLAPGPLSAATHTVTSLADSGPGSLRQAILDANANPGPDAIHFAITGSGPHTIAPSTPLPAITDPVTIDGFTQPGASANSLAQGNNAQLRIELSGQNIAVPADGLAVATSNCLVRGLVINRWTGNGLFVFGTNNVIQGSFIGTDVLGSSALTNSLNGVLLAVSSHGRVGGTAPAERNVISANGENGVFIASLPGVSNRVEGNFIGVNAAGTVALGNGVYGVRVNYSSDNAIGGAAPGAGNLISGNLYGAIGVWYDTAATRIQGNLIGTDVTGLVAVPNLSGIGLNSNRGTLIGGSNAGEGNLVSGNPGGGIAINGGGSHRVEGNRIGTDATGSAALANLDHGILIQSSTNNTIGGTSAQVRNLISGNGLSGIYIGTDGGTSSNNVIQGNFIGTNPSATAAVPNGTRFSYPGIILDGTSHNLIGGDMPEARNVIAGNQGHGVFIQGGSSNVVCRNHIGTDQLGQLSLANLGSGVRIENSAGNQVEQCQISGNTEHGVHILGAASVGNRVLACSIGVFLDRPYSFGNGLDGVHIDLAPSNTINGVSIAGSHGHGVILIDAPGTVIEASRIGNVVDDFFGTTYVRPVGNSGHGVFVAHSAMVQITVNTIGPSGGDGLRLEGATTLDCVVTGNFIGIDGDGTTLLNNGLAGVSILQASNNQIGGAGGQANRMAHNATGVSVAGPRGTNNVIRFNSISDNTGLGIDLDATGISADGPTPNDADDADEGPNHLQNFPVITLVSPGAHSLLVEGSLASVPNTAYVLDFYANQHPSGSSQGQLHLGSAAVTTGAGGGANFTALLAPFPAGWSGVSATATDVAGNTSEFSPAAAPGLPLLIEVRGSGSVVRTPDKPFYAYGETVTLTAEPGRYHTFQGWTDGTTFITREVIIGSDNIYTAVFAGAVPLETRAFKQWDRSFGGVSSESALDIRATLDGGFVVAGWTQSGVGGTKTTPLCGGVAIWVLKLDGAGNKEWEQTIGEAGTEFYSVSLVETSDGGFALGAYSRGDPSPVLGQCGKTAGHFGGSDMWLVRLDSQGRRLWDAAFGGAGEDGVNSLRQTRDGGFILAGQSKSGASGNKSSPSWGGWDVWVVRVDAGGSKLWDRSFGGQGSDGAFAVAETAEGGFLVGGTSDSEAGVGKTAGRIGDYDYWVLRLDAAGNKVWEHAYGGTGIDNLFRLDLAPDGGAVLSGHSQSGADGTKTTPAFGEWDAWLVRIDAAGEPLWDRSLGGEGDEFASESKTLGDGGVFLAAVSTSAISGNKSSPSQGGLDGWAVRLDASGQPLWDFSVGGSANEDIYGAAVAADGGLVLAGGSDSSPGGNKTSPHHGGGDFWVVKLAERTAPVGTPVVLGNGVYSPSNAFVFGEELTVTMTSSYPNAQIYYTLDGTPPTLGSALYSDPVHLSDSATVRAVAYRQDLTDPVEADAVTLTLFSPPVIVMGPQDQEVMAGAAVQFEALAAGLLPLSYQWLHNGVALPGQTAATLDLSAAQLSDEGLYAVTVSNPLGEVTSQAAQLTVKAAPVILAGPSSLSVVQGGSARFEVKATGTAPLAYQWYFGDQPLMGQTASMLVIPSAATAHAGSYLVAVINAFGTTFSSMAALNVVVPAGIVQGPSGLSVAPGQPAEFCVNATGSDPIRYQWRKNGVNIPQATQRCYSIPSVRISDGGSYSVVVANDAGAVNSVPVELVVQLPALVPGDDFAERVAVDATPSFRASNVGAGKEAGEPPHAGNDGGASMWFTWRAPASGVATFQTSGSSIDTLLAVYQGVQVGQLVLVAQDEDQDGFLASRARFNAVAGQDYEVAVDGFDGAMGAFTLSWAFEATAEQVPVITSQPHSATVPMGGQATFEVAVDDPTVVYQWFFNGTEISGADESIYQVDNASRQNVGYYTVRATNPAGRWAESLPAVLEIGPVEQVQTRDKVPYPNFGSGLQGLSHPWNPGKGAGLASLTGGGILVGAGATGTQILNNTNSLRQPGEPNHCGRLGSATRWMVLRTGDSGLEFSIDTEGSDIATLLAVYSRASILEPLAEVACDRSGTSVSLGARVIFSAQTGLDYWVAVDGVDGAQGIIQLNWGLGGLPAPGVRAADETIALGGSVHWHVDVQEAVPAASIQWRRNGQDLNGRTGTALSLENLAANDAGNYSVRLSNEFGSREWEVGLVKIDTGARARAGSAFEAGDEGWRVWDGQQTAAPTHVPPAGNQDGLVAHALEAQPRLWYWAAPEPYLGNRSGAYSGRLEFELGKSPTATRVDQEDVLLSGAGEVLVYDLELGADGVMVRYQVPLVESAGWRVGTRAGLPATETQLLKVLGALEGLYIRASHSLEPHTTWFDTVRMVEPTQSDVSWLRARWLGPGSVELEWPENAGAFQLIEREELTLGNWTPVQAIPVLEEGYRRVRLPVAASPSARFYRLLRH